MPDFLIDQGGAEISPDSILAHLSRESQNRIDALISLWTHPDQKQFTIDAWNGHEPELGRYDEDTVKELGKHTI